QQALRLLQARRRKTFGKTLVNRLENSHRLSGTALTVQKLGKAEGSTQFPKQGTLLLGHLARLVEEVFGGGSGSIPGLQKQHLALDAKQFGDIPLFAVFPCPGRLDRLAHGIVCLVEPPQPGERKGKRSHKLGVSEPPACLIAGVEGFAKDGQALRE